MRRYANFEKEEARSGNPVLIRCRGSTKQVGDAVCSSCSHRQMKQKQKNKHVEATFVPTTSQRATVSCRPPSCSRLRLRSPTVCLSNVLKLHTGGSRVREAPWLSATRRWLLQKIRGEHGRGPTGPSCTGPKRSEYQVSTDGALT